MKDYSSYITSPISKIQSSAEKIYNNQLQLQGVDVLVNDVVLEEKVIIRNHGNPTNEFEEERYLIFRKSLGIERGSIISYLNENYIVITDIDKEELVYNTCKMKKTNNILNFQLKSSSTVYSIPCVFESSTVSSSNQTDDNKYFMTNDDVAKITIPNNDITSLIGLNHRFIFNSNINDVYKCSRINDVDTPGLLYLTLEHDQYNKDTDNLELNIADYFEADQPSETDYSIVLSGDDFVVSGGFDYTYTAKVYLNGVEDNTKTITFSVNNSLVTINSTIDKTCILTTNENGETGSLILKATLDDDNTVFTEKTINVRLF